MERTDKYLEEIKMIIVEKQADQNNYCGKWKNKENMEIKLKKLGSPPPPKKNLLRTAVRWERKNF